MAIHWKSIQSGLQKWWPLAVLLIVVAGSFTQGWYFDHSHPLGGLGWVDQTLYTHSADHMANGQLPTKRDLQYSIGYPLMGTVGHFVSSTDPFVAPSFALILARINGSNLSLSLLQ